MRHDVQIRNHIHDDEAVAMRAAGFCLTPVGSTAVQADAPDGGTTFYVDGVKIAFHPRDPNLKSYSVVSRNPSPNDLFGRACFATLEEAVAYIKSTH